MSTAPLVLMALLFLLVVLGVVVLLILLTRNRPGRPPMEQDDSVSVEEPEPRHDTDPVSRKDDEFMSTHQSAEVADDARADGFPVVRISELHEVVDGGFGIGSAAPIADGAQPLGHPIKANRDTKTYQDLHSPWYAETQPDVWFLDVGFAERAGFRRAE